MRQQILTLTVLLLSVTTHISAQERNSAQTLKGLSGIGLVVRYGNVDGLETAMQPAILQMLQDRARDLLRQGEVPLLQSTSEADMIGRPRLVFTVTAKKKGEIPPAILIESELYQRVSLWRDQAKEMELATWSTGSIGPHVSHPGLFALFEQQVNAFVRNYRAMNPHPPKVESRTDGPPAQLRDNALSLQGLTGVRLIVSLGFIEFEDNGRQVEVDRRFQDPAFSKMLQVEAENRFKQAGIPLLRNETDRTGRPLLHVSMNLCQPNFHSPGIGVNSTFWEGVRLVRDTKKDTYAVTWKSYAGNGWPITDEAIRKALNSQLDEFIKAYNAANPKLSSVAEP